jgi:precorrin-3B C17-methyltransferase
VQAQEIILKYRSADTPVAIVKSAYREAQNIQMVRLDQMKDCKIGMLSTVLIGNSFSYEKNGLMITPRGYANKYDDVTGEIKDGEKAGRSLSMGLEGWHACVRQYIRAESAHSLRDISGHFDCSPLEILSAISKASVDDNAAGYSAIEVKQGSELQALEAAGQWGKVRAVVRSDAGAVSELLLEELCFVAKGDWMNIENPHFHLHVNWSKVKSAWMLKKNDSLRSVHFLDARGDTVFNVSLVREQGALNPVANDHYETVWATLSAH